MRIRSVMTLFAVASAGFLLAGSASAQAGGGGSWGWGTGTPGTTWGTPPPPTSAPPPSSRSGDSSEVEIGVLYGTAATYGVGTGIWLDAETGLDDPGLKFIPPVVLGLAAPVGVYFLDQPPLPRGTPAAISAGMIIGAGEGLGIWSYQFTATPEDDAWGFRGLSRAMTLGGALGGVGGYALAYYQEPSPKTSLFVGSSVVWGSVIGSMIGYGSTKKGLDYGQANEGASLGGLVGYNVALGATAAISMAYIPSYESIGWMWVGGGIGAAAGLPIYLAYAGSDKPAKRGLIVQGILTGLGITAAGIFTSGMADSYAVADPPSQPTIAQITMVGIMPIEGGAGVQMTGLLF